MIREKLLPEFQDYLLAKRVVAGKNIPFYAWWASQFLTFNNGNEHLPLEVRIDHFLRQLEVKKPLADWQLRQAEEAVRLYVGHFLSGNTTKRGARGQIFILTISPNVPKPPAGITHNASTCVVSSRPFAP